MHEEKKGRLRAIIMKNPKINPGTSRSVLQMQVFRVSEYFLFVLWVMLMFWFGLLKPDQRTDSVCECICLNTKADQRNVTQPWASAIISLYLEKLSSVRRDGYMGEIHVRDRRKLTSPFNGLCVYLVPDDWSRTLSRWSQLRPFLLIRSCAGCE